MSIPDSTTPNAAASVTFCVGLPPKELRSNSRAFWAAKVKAKQAYSRAVWGWMVDAYGGDWTAYCRSWKRARVTYTWRYAGVAPDAGNLGPNLKALQDILCQAPDTGKLAVNNTTYLGLVEDDKGIEPVYKLEKVQRRAAEGVSIRIERLEVEAAMTERTLDDIYPRPWSVEETWDGPAVIDAKHERIALIRKNPERGFFLANRIVAAINAMEDVTTFPGESPHGSPR